MTRVLWFVGEVIVGLVASGVTAALLVPAVARTGREPEAPVLWVSIAVTVLVSIVAGEWLRARRGRRAP